MFGASSVSCSAAASFLSVSEFTDIRFWLSVDLFGLNLPLTHAAQSRMISASNPDITDIAEQVRGGVFIREKRFLRSRLSLLNCAMSGFPAVFDSAKARMTCIYSFRSAEERFFVTSKSHESSHSVSICLKIM